MAAVGVFALLQAVAVLKYLQNYLTKSEFKTVFFFAGTAAAGLVFLAVVGLTWAGVIAPWSGRFYSLWDTGYAKIHIPIIGTYINYSWTLKIFLGIFSANI